MDFPKLVWMVERKALYFCGVHTLADPLEGRHTEAMRQRLARECAHAPESSKRVIPALAGWMDDVSRTHFYVNCWTVDQY